MVADWAGRHTSAELAGRLERAGVPSGIVATATDLFDDPQLAARDMLLRVDDDLGRPVIMPGIVPKLTRTPGAVAWSGGSRPGHDNCQVLNDLLGLSEAEVAELTAEGVL